MVALSGPSASPDGSTPVTVNELTPLLAVKETNLNARSWLSLCEDLSADGVVSITLSCLSLTV